MASALKWYRRGEIKKNERLPEENLTRSYRDFQYGPAEKGRGMGGVKFVNNKIDFFRPILTKMELFRHDHRKKEYTQRYVRVEVNR